MNPEPPTEIGLALGSNVGDRSANMARATKAILEIPGLTLLEQSPIYETDPVGLSPEQSHMRFLNSALIVEYAGEIGDLANHLSSIETTLGREKERGQKDPPAYAQPRTIDIDIIYAGNIVLKDEDLTIPHPRWATREFVVRPLCDIRPSLKIAGEDRTVNEILLSLPPGPKVIPFEEGTNNQ